MWILIISEIGIIDNKVGNSSKFFHMNFGFQNKSRTFFMEYYLSFYLFPIILHENSILFKFSFNN